MKLLVKRTTKTSLSVIGELWIDGVFYCYTLEPPDRSESIKPRAIPLGTYDVTIRQSPRFGRLMPHIEKVPDFSEVLIHWGNFPSDTLACLLVGKYKGPNPDFIGQSRLTFNPLFLRLTQTEEPITISYADV